MAEQKEIILTGIGMNALKSGLEYLKTTRRSEITEKIKVARGFGDLSENAEYDEAKNEQAEVESKINQLMNILKYARTITADEITDGVVCIGNTVEIIEVGEEDVEKYSIVSPDEIEMYAILNKTMSELLSANSPVGKELLGHKEGETVSVTTPVCTIDFSIEKIYKYE